MTGKNRIMIYGPKDERIEGISDSMRQLIEPVWPELIHKLPPERWTARFACCAISQMVSRPGSQRRESPPRWQRRHGTPIADATGQTARSLRASRAAHNSP
jgi:hypothetical protein